MNSYTAGLHNQTIELEAKDLWSAKQKAIEILKPKKKDMSYLWVILNTVHDTSILD